MAVEEKNDFQKCKQSNFVPSDVHNIKRRGKKIKCKQSNFVPSDVHNIKCRGKKIVSS